jgi:hypothetical protein
VHSGEGAQCMVVREHSAMVTMVTIVTG